MSEASGSDSNPSEGNLDFEEFAKIVPKKIAQSFVSKDSNHNNNDSIVPSTNASNTIPNLNVPK